MIWPRWMRRWFGDVTVTEINPEADIEYMGPAPSEAAQVIALTCRHCGATFVAFDHQETAAVYDSAFKTHAAMAHGARSDA